MNYGMYLAATGVLTSMYRQDVLANNLANVNTVGFKPDVVYTRLRLPERLESGGASPQQLLERLGGGHLLSPTRLDLTQGSLTDTGNDLDLAIEGEGFFVVRSTGPGDEQLRLTRDGRFTLNRAGELVMAGTGMSLLDTENQPIRLDRTATVHVRSNGELVQDGKVRATLRIAAATDQSQLSKLGNNLLTVNSNDPQALRPADGRLLQRHLESSAVNPVMMLNAMISASKAASANLKMMQYHDHMIGQAVNTLGRVA
ncbi:MAG: flagellar hook-basal body protein [Planctomycetes bacterium]|nr:flagellar hook-basal body protein [Planctomycetota bacterium]MCH8259242.1 flagellar hook-basal body protein [Planctomycetota bacterium]